MARPCRFWQYLDEQFCQQAAFTIAPGNYIKLSLQDTGKGIDPTILKLIFEPFFTTKGVGEGTGLGLAAVYGIVVNHHGMIIPQSQVGVGTDFTIYLPVLAGNSAMHESPETEDISGQGCILLVDDEEVIRETTKAMLAEMGYDVITAIDGLDAVSTFKENLQTIDLVLMDLVMPNKNGHEASSEMSDIDPAVKIIFTSGFAKDSKSLKSMMDSTTAFVQKPYRKSKLGKLLKEQLGRPG